jgi:hypothetical protein
MTPNLSNLLLFLCYSQSVLAGGSIIGALGVHRGRWRLYMGVGGSPWVGRGEPEALKAHPPHEGVMGSPWSRGGSSWNRGSSPSRRGGSPM